MEETQPTNGAPQPMLQPAPNMRNRRFVPFDQHQRATIQKAQQQFLQVVVTVASCMGLAQAQMNEDLTGFFVDE
jgi:hypothetical protein